MAPKENDGAMSGLEAALARMKFQASVAKPVSQMEGTAQRGRRGGGAFSNRSGAAAPVRVDAPTPAPPSQPATRHVTFLDFGVERSLPAASGTVRNWGLKTEQVETTPASPMAVEVKEKVAPPETTVVHNSPNEEKEAQMAATIPTPMMGATPSRYLPPTPLASLNGGGSQKVGKYVKTKPQCRKWDQTVHRPEACDYHHPKTHCSRIPNCPFGAVKCLYAHPFCSLFFCSCKPGLRSPQLNHWIKSEEGALVTCPDRKRPAESAFGINAGTATFAAVGARGRTVKTSQQCFYWNDEQHSKAGCRFWHPIVPCKFYPRCMTGPKDCLFGHPFCTKSGFCKCAEGGSASDQLNHATCATHPGVSQNFQ